MSNEMIDAIFFKELIKEITNEDIIYKFHDNVGDGLYVSQRLMKSTYTYWLWWINDDDYKLSLGYVKIDAKKDKDIIYKHFNMLDENFIEEAKEIINDMGK